MASKQPNQPFAPYVYLTSTVRVPGHVLAYMGPYKLRSHELHEGHPIYDCATNQSDTMLIRKQSMWLLQPPNREASSTAGQAYVKSGLPAPTAALSGTWMVVVKQNFQPITISVSTSAAAYKSFLAKTARATAGGAPVVSLTCASCDVGAPHLSHLFGLYTMVGGWRHHHRGVYRSAGNGGYLLYYDAKGSAGKWLVSPVEMFDKQDAELMVESDAWTPEHIQAEAWEGADAAQTGWTAVPQVMVSSATLSKEAERTPFVSPHESRRLTLSSRPPLTSFAAAASLAPAHAIATTTCGVTATTCTIATTCAFAGTDGTTCILATTTCAVTALACGFATTTCTITTPNTAPWLCLLLVAGTILLYKAVMPLVVLSPRPSEPPAKPAANPAANPASKQTRKQTPKSSTQVSRTALAPPATGAKRRTALRASGSVTALAAAPSPDPVLPPQTVAHEVREERDVATAGRDATMVDSDEAAVDSDVATVGRDAVTGASPAEAVALLPSSTLAVEGNRSLTHPEPTASQLSRLELQLEEMRLRLVSEQTARMRLETQIEQLVGAFVPPSSTSTSAMVSADEDLCVVCLEEPRTHAFVSCMHKCVCGSCVEDMTAWVDGGAMHCPLCREVSPNVSMVFG
uniref:RING-type domain-containing protein n=1 Tax=Haptolina ericina TaxID=156174 RepID=A0A7S3BQJ8_9EUKA